MPCPERRLRLHCSYSSHCRPVALPLCLRHGCVRLLPHCSGCWSCTCGASIHGWSARARSSTRCRQSRRSRHGHGMARRALACAQCAMDRRAHGSVRVHVLDHGGHARTRVDTPAITRILPCANAAAAVQETEAFPLARGALVRHAARGNRCRAAHRRLQHFARAPTHAHRRTHAALFEAKRRIGGRRLNRRIAGRYLQSLPRPELFGCAQARPQRFEWIVSDALLAEMLTIEPRTGVVDKESHVVRAPLSCACDVCCNGAAMRA